MVFSLPPYTGTDPEDGTKKFYQSNISYNPLYNNIYDIKPILEQKPQENERKVDIFEMSLITIMKNIANTLLLIIRDLTNVKNYSNMKNFISIFIIENRLVYVGIFVIFFSLYMMLFLS